MEPKKYWWMYGLTKGPGMLKQTEAEFVIDIHPFIFCKAKNLQLVVWNLISAEEFNLFNQLNENK